MGGSYGTIASADGQQPKLGGEALGGQSTEDGSIEPVSALGLFTAMIVVGGRW